MDCVPTGTIGPSLTSAEAIVPSNPFPIHLKFETRAAATPSQIALFYGARSLTYDELNARANQLARYMRRQDGLAPERIVGVSLERSVELVVAVLAIAKAGLVCLPLDPSYPSARLGLMVEDANPALLLTGSATTWSPIPVRSINVHEIGRELTNEPAGNLRPAASAESLAYVVYTSGSTGRPKGVAMPHDVLSRMFEWHDRRPTSRPGMRTLQFAPLSFDVAFQEIFTTLGSGGTLVLVDETTRRDFPALVRFVTEKQIERLFFPFVALHVFAEAATHQGLFPPFLREIITAGERLRLTTPIREFFAALPQCTLHNQYGPAETHVVTEFSLAGSAASWPELPPIGKPIPGAKILLFDEALQPVTPGQVGEICIGGSCLARGYFARPELTAERFITWVGPKGASRLYRTGDLGRLAADGNLEFVGRLGDQVKIRGARVEPAEIEIALREFEPVSDAVVLAMGDDGEKYLVSHVTARAGYTVAASEVRDFLSSRLPDYMVPSLILPIEEFPLTATGKIDRQALLAAAHGRRGGSSTIVPPRNQLQSQLQTVWEDILQRQPIGVTENFFELGGDSLRAVRLLLQIEEATGRTLSLATLIQAPTIAQLVEQMLAGSDRTEGPLVAINPTGSRPPFFCVAGWFDLARHLPADQPFYGPDLRAVEKMENTAASIKAAAQHLIAQLQELRPHGPYILGGHCLGGIVAFEMAQQLTSKGEKISLVALLDPESPAPIGFVRNTLDWGLYRSIFHLRQLRRVPRGQRTKYFSDRLQNVSRRLFNLDQKDSSQKKSQPEEAYVPEPYSGRIALFLAGDTPMRMHADRDPRLQWKKLANGPFAVHEVSGGHAALLKEPHVQDLALELGRYLDATR